MQMLILAAFFCGIAFTEAIILGALLFQEFAYIEKLREIEARQAAGEWLPADQC